MKIGLTGGMLSGKTSALKFFKACGARVLSADEIVADLLKTPRVKQILSREFGASDKAALKKLLAVPARRKKLESILHPLVKEEALKFLRASGKKITVFEVPLLFEAGWTDMFDLTLAVAGADLTARLKKRGVSRADYNIRAKAQLPEEEKLARADLVVFNAGTLKDLEVKIKKIYKIINGAL